MGSRAAHRTRPHLPHLRRLCIISRINSNFRNINNSSPNINSQYHHTNSFRNISNTLSILNIHSTSSTRTSHS